MAKPYKPALALTSAVVLKPGMQVLSQSPLDPAFVQDPYAVYARVLAAKPVCYWQDYGMLAAFDAKTVQAVLRDRRFGREEPPEQRKPVPEHLTDFYKVDAVSMLDLEAPAHTRLRGLVLRAFTSRRIQSLAFEIEKTCDALIAAFPSAPFDLLKAYCSVLPVRIIARLLGVPEDRTPDLLRWSNAMVAMYQARRTKETEIAANDAAAAFTAFLNALIDTRRVSPGDDLLSQLIAAENEHGRLTRDEVIGTAILLLNAGHEATVHTLGNAVKILLEHQTPLAALDATRIGATVEEILRFDPPLHLFTRYAYEDAVIAGHSLKRGDQIALILGGAGRDPRVWQDPNRFDPSRPAQPHAAFGGGIHFCVGAPLARLELAIGLQRLFAQCPHLRLVEPPRFADTYHFHGLEQLIVSV